ncbi:hypothetical protein DESAMIL20_551 [Desulfurella amilsii]|uniref:NIF system FeS cluster assembly NifU N-terminal domain-containing protein n=1 Tax=Desulfurella amilsii TaxID=1562698 RepID=A0A1X4XYQ5_9BACT|nr:iron-sulfur cluster assembly scaffold protein [Desulfurella amilsii]OSS42667.1 hypothetical protein DESAMIL20_551 [Desulfurella amilsii]
METFENHFFNPIRDTVIQPDGIGIRENKEFNAKIIFYVNVKDSIITAIDYKVKACPVAIAVASFLAKTFKNKPSDEALDIDLNFLDSHLLNIPRQRIECGDITLEAFQEAVIKAIINTEEAK